MVGTSLGLSYDAFSCLCFIEDLWAESLKAPQRGRLQVCGFPLFCVVLLTFATLLTLVPLDKLLFLLMATAVWGVMLSHLKKEVAQSIVCLT